MEEGGANMDDSARATMRKIGDYPGVSSAHLDMAKAYSSPLLLGPPICDEFINLVEHMFTGEEAEIARHIKPWRLKGAASIASATGRPLSEVREILHRLAHEKYVLISVGGGEKERFAIMPIVPGTFEHVLIRKSPDSVTPWHRRFAELFEALYSTGYVAEYNRKPTHSVRYLPVMEAVEAIPMALPSDRLEVILDDYRDFAVGVCQCRLTKNLLGEGCGRPLEVCLLMGDFVPRAVDEGRMRRIDKREALEIKMAAEKEGLITWMLNDRSSKSFRCSCSCCGCCCDALRQITEFNAPGFIAPPHFMPHIDSAACNACGKCARVCTLKAVIVTGEAEEKRVEQRLERCIGCGLCAVACPEKAVTMREVPDYREPAANVPAYLARYWRSFAMNGYKVWSSRRHGG
jgi:Pyruvate/2-oxoacid:ferredoxin oxidoreductase delta subunit